MTKKLKPTKKTIDQLVVNPPIQSNSMDSTEVIENQTININKPAKDVLLNVKNLNVSFKLNRKKIIKIVRGVDLKILKGQIVGLVGESGSGKSVTSKALMNINEFAITESNEMKINDISLKDLKKKDWSKIRGKKIGYIPQDPLTSLNPTRTIGKQLLDVLLDSEEFSSTAEKVEYLVDLLESFGIRDAKNKFNEYPHTFSGGMKQRVVIAMIVAAKPELIIADEPTTALDPTVQASVLSLFEDIRKKFNISIIFISHNISVIAKFCDYIYVMYAGKIVEEAPISDLFKNPLHPYTQGLIASVPKLGSGVKVLPSIPGSVPDLSSMPKGCRFAPRCKDCMDICKTSEPEIKDIGGNRRLRCWLENKEGNE